ncbi:MAG: biopolymer transporter ExbD [Labilithrix sp.]|nr:biopolymer transporter ExbD [Labilithrix sp.]MCW5813975.1 biopolymer transporter ExbD [Labilithrix sp.]
MLVLLIIFMVMTPTLLKEVDVKVPDKAEVETNATPSSTEEIVVSVAANGRFQLNHEPIDDSRLGDRIREAMAVRTEKRVFFEIDDDALYGDAMHAMDICRGAGAKTLGLMTKSL